MADAATFDPPSNYRLLRMTRYGTDAALEKYVRRGTAPVIVVDPRAGHGPGIVGFKRDSEVSMSLLERHPTYFVVFDPEPTWVLLLMKMLATRQGCEPLAVIDCQRRLNSDPLSCLIAEVNLTHPGSFDCAARARRA